MHGDRKTNDDQIKRMLRKVQYMMIKILYIYLIAAFSLITIASSILYFFQHIIPTFSLLIVLNESFLHFQHSKAYPFLLMTLHLFVHAMKQRACWVKRARTHLASVEFSSSRSFFLFFISP